MLAPISLPRGSLSSAAVETTESLILGLQKFRAKVRLHNSLPPTGEEYYPHSLASSIKNQSLKLAQDRLSPWNFERQLSGNALAISVSAILHKVNPPTYSDDYIPHVISPERNYQGEVIMNVSPQIEPVSTERLLSCLGLAIDEAKLVRSIIKSKDMAYKLKAEKPLSKRLTHIDREISYLKAKLEEVRLAAKQC